jgi:hypothetical protein
MGTGLCASTVSTVLAKHTCDLCRLRYSWNAVTNGGEAVGCPVELVLSTATHKLHANSVTSHNSAVEQLTPLASESLVSR